MSSKKRKTPSSNGTTIPPTAHVPPSSQGGEGSATTDNNTEKWRCDVCLIATFDTYDEAWVHEQSCTNNGGGGTNNNNSVVSSNTIISGKCDNGAEGVSGQSSGGTTSSVEALGSVSSPSKPSPASASAISTLSGGDNKNGAVLNQDGNNIAHEFNNKGEEVAAAAAASAKKLKPNTYPTTTVVNDDNATLSSKKAETSNTSSKATTSSATSGASSAQTEETTASNKRKTNWRCDVCLEAVFEEYDEAVEHEKTCTGSSSGKGSNTKSSSSKKKKAKKEDVSQQKEEAVQQQPFVAEVVHTQASQAQALEAQAQGKNIQKGSFVIVYRYLGKDGVNPGGVGQVTNIHKVVSSDGSQKTTCDVDWILGGHEKNIDSGSIVLSEATNWEDAKKDAERWDDMNKRYMAAMNTKKSPTKKKTPSTKVIVKPMAARSPAPLLHSPIEEDKVEQDLSMTHNDSFEHSPNSAFTTLPRSSSSGTMQQQQVSTSTTAASSTVNPQMQGVSNSVSVKKDTNNANLSNEAISNLSASMAKKSSKTNGNAPKAGVAQKVPGNTAAATSTGVSEHKGKWRVRVHYKGKERWIGSYDTKEDAELTNKVVRETLNATKDLVLSQEEVDLNIELAKRAASNAVSDTKSTKQRHPQRVDVLSCQGDTSSYSVSAVKAGNQHSRPKPVIPKNPPQPLQASEEKDVGDFSEMTVPQLKERLKDSNLPVSGRKQELIDRLNDHIGAKLVEGMRHTLNMDTQGADETETGKDGAPAPATTDNGSPPPQTTHVVKSRTRRVILLALPVALVAIAPLHLPERLLAMLLLPTVTFITLAIILLIMFAYSTFAFTMIITHEGRHHHQTQGLVTDIYLAARDYLCQTSVDASTDESDGEETSTPTLREYLEHPDGFHMSFAPAFFGFFAYFGCLAALEEETHRIVPTLPAELQQENGDDANSTSACGLRSVSGASAGAMSAVMLASGIQPRDAAEFASKFSWGEIADPPGIGGYVRGNNFEAAMRTFISDAAKIQRSEGDKEVADNVDTPFQLEEALVPVSVSGFDLLTMKGKNITKGCMAKAARASAGFPLLFQPVSWRESDDNTNNSKKKKWLPDSLLIDGGITDSLGLNGLSSNGDKKKRVVNLVVGDFGYKGPSGVDSLPPGVNATSLVSVAIVGTPMCGPWAMKNGPRAVESARKAMVAALDQPMERGTSDNHYVLRVDGSKWLD